uniref:metallophosphoesterase n=1 Tax=Agathobacter sp. TaxID=2021311 RepID=UPI0040565368
MFNIFCDKNEVVENYVEWLYGNLFEEKKHPWMRSDLFDDENYQCHFRDQKISLSSVFWENERIKEENIIIISGEKHIGKSFFVEKILKKCVDAYKEKNGKFNIGDNARYRIPILVFREWFEEWIENRGKKQNAKELNLEELIFEVIVDTVSVSDRDRLKAYISKALSYGKFVVYFESNEWLKTEELSKLLNYGKEIVTYRKDSKYRNIMLLTCDVEKVKNSFFNERNCGYIELKKLREEEITAYLERNKLSSLLNIAKDNPDVMRLMGYPEHLRMFEILSTDKLIDEENPIKDIIKNKFELYDFFIRGHIRDVLERENQYSEQKEKRVFESLQKYAWEKCVLENGKPTGKNMKEALEIAKKCGLVMENGGFSFPYCGYYLAACELIRRVSQKGRNNSKSLHPDTVKEENIENILIFASRMIEDEELFAKYWDLVADYQKYPLLLLAKIVNESRHKKSYEEELYKKAFEHLKSEFYDYSVLETFEELKPECANYLKSRYFRLDKYEETERNNIKKRMIYYLGISHNGILEKMIDELITEGTDRHLQYHIIRAAVENYQAGDENTKKLIDERIEDIALYCNKNQDPIIMSDFCVLYKLCKEHEWQSAKDELDMQNRLKAELESKTYWVRAHAAGAIGRKQVRNTFELLLQRIQSELQFIYELSNDYRNSIKVISYSVEAICEWYNRKENAEEKDPDSIVKELVKLIEVPKMRNQEIEDAYSTIVTGIEYIISNNRDKPAFNLGGRFRNRTSNHRRVVLYIMEELLGRYKDDGELSELAKEKCEALQNVSIQEMPTEKRVKRILHLSDWHLMEDSTHNNMIVRQLTKYLPIDILVVTGDLKQFGADYTRTLEILNRLKMELNLTPKDIFIVPGNHDSAEIPNQKEIYSKIRKELYENTDIYRDYAEEVYSAFDSYKEFVMGFFGLEYYEHGGIHNRILVWENCVQILCMNTSLVCDGTKSKEVVNTYELSELKSKGNLPVIAISHHPFGSLHDGQRTITEHLLKELKVSVLLSGDEHHDSAGVIGNKETGIPNLVIGKSFKEVKDTYSELNIAIYDLNFERKKMATYLKKWENGVFEPSTRFSKEDGISPCEIDLLYEY